MSPRLRSFIDPDPGEWDLSRSDYFRPPPGERPPTAVSRVVDGVVNPDPVPEGLLFPQPAPLSAPVAEPPPPVAERVPEPLEFCPKCERMSCSGHRALCDGRLPNGRERPKRDPAPQLFETAAEEHAARLAWDNEHPEGAPFPADAPSKPSRPATLGYKERRRFAREQLQVAPAAGSLPLVVEVDCRVESLNRLSNERYFSRAHRRRREYSATMGALVAHPRPPLPAEGEPPIVVRFVRLAPALCDDDNLSGAFKVPRDAVADYLGVDDGPRETRVRWTYGQEKRRERTTGAKGKHAFRCWYRVEIEREDEP